MAPIILGFGLLVGYPLTARLVPMVWGSMLPGGLEQASHFYAWPGLLWAMAVYTHDHFLGTVAILSGIGGVGFLMSTFMRPMRPLVWLMALTTIGIDAGIVYVTLRVAIEATAQHAGMM